MKRLVVLHCLLLLAACGKRPVEGRKPESMQQANRPAVETERLNVKKNRLAEESSPYLLQHADNPVNWYPWEREAFEAAKKENKPIFLSIGYATCHWCHVMEHESFEDEDVAALLNKHFICIKVDREERPDIDAVYMSVTQSMTGNGGWPMTIVMTPDMKPFFAGTYFPKKSIPGRGAGLLDLLPMLAEAWQNKRQLVLKAAEEVTQAVRDDAKLTPGWLSEAIFATATKQLSSVYDAESGGFGEAPKFPTPQNLIFLMRRYERRGNRELLAMVEKTLTAMRLSGMYDQVGFGFHRYSTDRSWLVPHFEKMLYDQALIALAYLEAYQLTEKDLYAHTAREIFSYVRRSLAHTDGAFYCAEDADSDGEEGGFYVWKESEIKDLLGEDAETFSDAFGVKKEGNFLDEATGRKTGNNILHAGDVKAVYRFEKQRLLLLDARGKRIRPLLDDKILTDWNGLMIAALSRGAQVLDEPAYANDAARAADFILANLRQRNGELMKRYRRGKAGLPAHLDDYAFLVWGLLELYEATFETRYLKAAITLTDRQINLFKNPDGAFYLTAKNSEQLLYRHMDFYDGALPSGNAVSAMNLLRLSHMTGRKDLRTIADSVFAAAAKRVEEQPRGHLALLTAYDFAVGPVREIVIAGNPSDDDTDAMVTAIQQHYLPRKVLLVKDPNSRELERVAPFTKRLPIVKGGATAYVCQNSTCSLPTQSVNEMLEKLGLRPLSAKR